MKGPAAEQLCCRVEYGGGTRVSPLHSEPQNGSTCFCGALAAGCIVADGLSVHERLFSAIAVYVVEGPFGSGPCLPTVLLSRERGRQCMLDGGCCVCNTDRDLSADSRLL